MKRKKSISGHTKYADDGTMWETHKVLDVAVKRVCGKASKVKGWWYWWRLSLSMTKTEGSLFPRMKLLSIPCFQLDGRGLKYNQTLKILGITPDE